MSEEKVGQVSPLQFELNVNDNKFSPSDAQKPRKAGVVIPRSTSYSAQLTSDRNSSASPPETNGLNMRSSLLTTIQSGVALTCSSLSGNQLEIPSAVELLTPTEIEDLAERLRKISRDAKPNINNYKTQLHASPSRPTLDELMQSNDVPPSQTLEGNKPIETLGDKFGWIEGVLIRNMLSIWGVMLFLRISWVVAVAGIWQTLIIIAISTFITMVTALSMSAICTNGEIGGGGTYYVMSRILGPEFGGSIGIIFAIANAINASLNVVGFCQTIQDAMLNYGGYIIVDGGANDIRIMGTILMILVWGLCGLGAKYEAKTQVVLLLILLVALTNFVVGSIMGPGESEDKRAKGFLGYDLELFAENWQPGYTTIHGQMQNFFSVFSVYFPAAIGILAGANISGDLKDPNSAIPKGTILAILITTFSYAVVAIICAGTTQRSATGCPPHNENSTCVPQNETYGSYYDEQLMTLISAYGPLNYAGCFAATLSSALASYISCPKLLQVIGDDKLYPYWLVGFMAKGYGKSNEPRLAYLFTFILALVFVLIADLDAVALLISCFFLATFALMNYSTFHISLVKPIGWRPTFKYYNMWLSLITAFLCIVAMFLISWPVALITIVVVFALYLAVLYRSPDVNWGSSSQAQSYREALSSMQQLAYTEEHVKNYRPQILALTGPAHHRPALVDFAYLICKNNSMLVCGNVVKDSIPYKIRAETQQKVYRHLKQRKVKGFSTLIDGSDMRTGTTAMLCIAGAGKMRPNILLMGYKSDWRTCDKNDLEQYFGTINAGFDMNVGVAILRLSEGLDYSGILGDPVNAKSSSDANKNNEKLVLKTSPSVASMLSEDGSNGLATPGYQMEIQFEYQQSEKPSEDQSSCQELTTGKGKKQSKRKKENGALKDANGNPLPKGIANKILVFQKKQKETVDVWWLYDDGGLTLLLPHIICTRSNWSSCKLRVLCTASSHEALEREHEGMAALLAKFRIEYSDLIVINNLSSKPPSNHTVTWFDGLVRHLIRREETIGLSAIQDELKRLREKTNRHLRLRELLIDHSSDSSLVVMTLPMPRKGEVSATVYMAWLETLTANMPPFLLVRGNQSSVLTFYS